MKKSIPTQINEFLQLDYVEDDSLWISGGRTLRRWIGILGMALPWLLYLFLYVDTRFGSPLPSISHYYFTRVSSVFVLILSVLAVFLFIYKGKEPIDFYTLSLPSGMRNMK
ncbi:hypothetical protein [Haliscomenobacter hydrossis]|uniref:Uncharacterized protein n=1 Tax=Haliscomenobacter hydrossis (strain ATCC 27775 / DSM 1100 / LMG 10767 / O) TaxID=760192 RepID=F4L0Z8_HALH1|nr:hypothetical protein [Haliscomenobacter hydrossis]AEE51585.1 hypothetical protein Halhy_3733 [Haliscomenobacter hydrossis DSM 1100]